MSAYKITCSDFTFDGDDYEGEKHYYKYSFTTEVNSYQRRNQQADLQ